jgi:hypothetical protein
MMEKDAGDYNEVSIEILFEVKFGDINLCKYRELFRSAI